jgi:hypothetical protein
MKSTVPGTLMIMVAGRPAFGSLCYKTLPNRNVITAIMMKIITRIFAISIENPAIPCAPNM